MKFLPLAVPALLASAAAQMPTHPPMKMGLWESGSTTTMSMPGMSMPPGMGARPMTARVCVTPESYAEAFSPRNAQQRSCTRTNQKWTANAYSFDIACSEGKSSGHFEMLFDSSEAGHGTMHIETNTEGHSMTMHSVITTHWVGADCGNLVPGQPVISR